MSIDLVFSPSKDSVPPPGHPDRFVLAAKATLHPLHLPRAMSNTGEHMAPVASQEGAHSTAEVWEGRRAEEAEKAMALSSAKEYL